MAEQMSRVSRKTDSICTRPCFTGWLTLAEAAALGAEPTPASLENRPRLMPCIRAEPVKPAKMAWKSKAPWKMRPNTWGSSSRFSTTTMIATSTYRPPMKGTRVEATAIIRLPPPMTQKAVSRAATPPMIQGVTPSL